VPPPAKPKPFHALAAAGVVVVVLGLAAPRLVGGPATPAPSPTPTADGPSLGGLIAKLVVGVGVAAGLCVAFARLAQKPPAAVGGMEVLASLAVGPGVVHLVRAGDRRLLVGTDAGGVKAVTELPSPPVEVAPLEAAAPAEGTQVIGPLPATVPAGFEAELAALLAGRGLGASEAR
jgi:flagellar biogenesis protein FliO